ncbi:MAG: hypothetical protein AAF806_19000 [Bacteroidota bacterium]
MIKLSDYLNYLSNEVAQARKQADVKAVELAKEYANHEYLRYFSVPRFSMPNVKLEIPIKITDLDALEYKFEMDEDAVVDDMNKKIEAINKERKTKIPLVNKTIFENGELNKLMNNLKVEEANSAVSAKEVDLSKPVQAIKQSYLHPTLSNDNKMDAPLETALREAIQKRYVPVSGKINEIYIDPNTTNEVDKDKIFIKLNVEMIEEGFKIVKVKNTEGVELEEIIFE